ncbi:hypothetical protein BsWGS_25492 [Bradybaena similaris]
MKLSDHVHLHASSPRKHALYCHSFQAILTFNKIKILHFPRHDIIYAPAFQASQWLRTSFPDVMPVVNQFSSIFISCGMSAFLIFLIYAILEFFYEMQVHKHLSSLSPIHVN